MASATGPSCPTFTNGTSLNSTPSAYTLSGLDPSTDYCFGVADWVNGNESSFDSIEANTAPSPPSDLTILSETSNSVTLGWTAPASGFSNSTAFVASGGCGGFQGQNVPGTATSATIGGLVPGRTYCFEVSAFFQGAGSTPTGPQTTTLGVAGPSNLASSQQTPSSISLDWTNPSGQPIQNDTVYVGDASCHWFPGQTFSTGGPAQSATISGLAPGTSYCFEVTDWIAGSQSGPSNRLLVSTLSVTAPTNLAVTGVTTSSVALAWSNPSGEPLANDTVYVRTGASCSVQVADLSTGGPATSYDVGSLAAGTSYCFYVQAWTTSGFGSAPTGPVHATTNAAPPGAPSWGASSVTYSSITLAWTNPAGTIVNDTVWFGPSCTSNRASFSTHGPATTLTLSTLRSNTTYCIWLAAWTNGGQGALASTELTTEYAPPSAPLSLFATPVSSASIDLNWTNPAGAPLVGNVIGYAAGSSCLSPLTLVRLPRVSTTSRITGLPPNATYCFVVAAETNGGEGAWSSPAYATTFNAPPSATPTSLTATLVGKLSVDLTWWNPTGPVTRDAVGSQVGCSGSWSNRTVNATLGVIQEYGFTHLLADSLYCFSVSAFTNGGEGPAAVTSARTANATGQPRGFVVNRLYYSPPARAWAANVSWYEPANEGLSGPITNNTLYVGTAPNADCNYVTWLSLFSVVPVNGSGFSAQHAIIPRLAQDTFYCFAVTAWATLGGEGSWDLTNATTGWDPPPAPIDVRAVAKGNTTVLMTWVDPPHVLSSTIYYGASCGGGPSSQQASVLGNNSVYTLFNLESGTLYCFQVSAATSGGAGPLSRPLNLTLPGSPPTYTTHASILDAVPWPYVGLAAVCLASVWFLFTVLRSRWEGRRAQSPRVPTRPVAPPEEP